MSEPDVTDLITVDRAIEILDAVDVHPRTRRVNLLDAQGLNLAQDITADRDYPPFDKSLMDGFALRNGDGDNLHIIGEIRAGEISDQPLAPRQAMSIMTGAPLP